MGTLSTSGWLAALEGFALGGGLIIAIGAQNAYLIRQGVRRNRVFLVATICFISDALLIIVGATGIGAIVAFDEVFRNIAAWGGAAFLLIYGAKAAYAALHPEPMHWQNNSGAGQGAWKIVLTTLALTYLNPHVYLDTVVLLGGVAAQYEPDARLLFAAGAVGASGFWFYGLAIFSKKVAGFFQTEKGARFLDLVVCFIMWSVAISLVRGVIA